MIQQFALMVRDKRKDLNWTQHQLALSSKLTRNVVGCIESEHHLPSLEQAVVLSHTLNLDMNELRDLYSYSGGLV